MEANELEEEANFKETTPCKDTKTHPIKNKNLDVACVVDLCLFLDQQSLTVFIIILITATTT